MKHMKKTIRGVAASALFCATTSTAVQNNNICSLDGRDKSIRLTYPQLRDAEGLAQYFGDKKAKASLRKLEDSLSEEKKKSIKKINSIIDAALQSEMQFYISFYGNINKTSKTADDMLKQALERIRSSTLFEKKTDNLFNNALRRLGLTYEDIKNPSPENAKRIAEEYERVKAGALTRKEIISTASAIQVPRARKINALRDKTLEELVGIIRPCAADEETANTVIRYKEMLRMLDRNITANTRLPYDVYAALTGFKNALRYMDFITKAASRLKIDKALAVSIIIKESSGLQNLVSSAGAVGLTQMMPSTITTLYNLIQRGKVVPSDAIKDFKSAETLEEAVIISPRISINAGLTFYKYLVNTVKEARKAKFGTTKDFDWTNRYLALALYNAGSGYALNAADEHGKYAFHLLGKGEKDVYAFPIVLETMDYVTRIAKYRKVLLAMKILLTTPDAEETYMNALQHLSIVPKD